MTLGPVRVMEGGVALISLLCAVEVCIYSMAKNFTNFMN